MSHRFIVRSAAVLAVGALALPLAACGSSTPAPATSNTTSSSSGTTAAQTSGKITVADFWVKAVDGNMTGAFGTITNGTDKAVTVVSGTSPVAGKVELHEVVPNGTSGTKMQPKEGGFPIAAGATYTLKPGGDHVMLMMLKQPLKAGDTVDFTLTMANGSTVMVSAPVKPFTAAQETYVPTKTS